MELEHNTVTVEQVPSGAPSVAVAKSIAALTRFCQAVALIALATLALRSALRLESQWDTFWYHLPFAAVRGGLSIPYDMNDVRRLYFEGFPPLPDLLQGILWRLTGSVNATGVVNYL